MDIKNQVNKAVIELVKIRARAWAIECGFREPIDLAEPEVVSYPKTGYGIHVHVVERAGRMATARFGPDGEPRYWSVEGAKAV